MDAKLTKPSTPRNATPSPDKFGSKQLWVGILLAGGLGLYVLKDKIPGVHAPLKPATALVTRTSNQAVLTVDLAPCSERSFNRNLLVSGTIWAWDPVQVGSEVNGLKVENVLVDDGARVRRGQVLARLNNSILSAQLAKKKANLIGARAALTKAIQPNRPEDLTSLQYAYHQAQANVAQDEANLARSEASLADASENARRYGWLVTQGAVSAQEADNRATQAKVYQAEVRNCQEKVKAAKLAAKQVHDRMTMGVAGGRREDIEISRSNVAEITASINELESQLAQTSILAPCDGLILKRSVHIGDIASVNKVMFDIVRDGRLELRANLPESDIALVKPGQTVTVDNAHGTRGVVREISPMIDQDTRLGMVRIDLPRAADKSLRPGNFAKGEIALGEQKVNAIPATAVVFKDNRSIIYTVDSTSDSKTKKAQMRYIVVGSRDGDYIEVLSGLQKGETVVAKGAGFIKDGDLVNVKENGSK
jgi:HlyD family secretion protein